MSKTDVHNGLVVFRALQLANEHRYAYGLRYNDYSRYRKHCGNRAHRLRSALKITHGKGRDFKKLPPVTLENIKSGHLQLILFEAERAWAYSQELLATSTQPSNEANANKIRHSATGRFRRAVHWATELLSHCQSLYSARRLSAQNFVEVSAYALVLSGRFLRYRDEHEDALEQLCVAHDLLDNLANCASTSHDQALAVLFSDEIGPEIRYCAHQLGHTKSYDIGRIVKEEAPKQRDILVEGYNELIKRLKSESLTQGDRGAKRLKSLVWEGQEVPVRNPELVDVLLQVQSAESKLTVDDTQEIIQKGSKGKGAKHHKSRRGVAAFDAVLSALSEAEEVARKLAEAQKTNENSSHNGTRDIHFLYSYITYHLLSRRIERDLTLISALVSASPTSTRDANKAIDSPSKLNRMDARVNPAVVKLLDTVLQSLTHMRNLHIVDDNPDLSNAIEARISYTKGRRCLFLSRSYAAVKQYPQAVALTQRSQLYARESSSLLLDDADPVNAGNPSFYSLTHESISLLQTSIQADEDQLKQDWFAFNGGSTISEKDNSKKPIFFDIALNYLQLDIDRMQERAGLKQKEIARSVPVEPKPVIVSAQSKVEDIQRSATPNPLEENRSTLTSLLGGWWGRK